MNSFEGYPEKCPVCGKKWIRRCRRDEWGYWYNNSKMQTESYLTLLCSGECSKAYAEQQLRKSALRIAKTKTYKALLMYRDGMSLSNVARFLGINADHMGSMIIQMQDINWKEIEWLDRHPEEVPA